MFVVVSIALVIIAGVALTYSVEVSYYDGFKRRIENGFRNWGLREQPTQEQVMDYFSDRNVIYLTFGITEYKTFSVVNKMTNEILFSNKRPEGGAENRLIDEFLESENYLAAMANQLGDKNKFLRIGDKIYFDYAVSKGDFIFYFRYDREDWKGTIVEFNRIIRISLIVAILISVVLGYFLSKTITRPIEELMYSARKIAKGDFGEVLQVQSNDEIGKLTGTFNYMSRKLKHTLSDIDKEKSKLETILKYLKDGVIAFNSKGEVIHANLTAKMILGVKTVDQSFDEFTSKFGIGISLAEIKKGEIASNSYLDVKILERVIKTYFAFFTDLNQRVEGIICVMHDVTEEKRLEDMQREFVANVSHELKTPLASIKSYTETMIDGVDYEVQQKFLNIVNAETDRMAKIVKELLQLSRIDSKRINWMIQEVDVNALIKSVRNKMEIELSNKNIEMDLDLFKNATVINGDYDKMEQVVVNILSNSIKYTPEGGRIQVNTGVLDDNIFVRVKDTGIGIPEDSLSRIFERFYRVDKARSRDLGGTGLGLSIAKEIIELHGGTISVASQLDQGTEVLITIPQKDV
jgi:two-component system, OmpR family, sensor histidine kinase VicK